MALLDGFGGFGVLGLAARDEGGGAQAPVGGLGHLGVVPQHLLVDAGQAADDLVVVTAGLEIGRRAAQETAGHHRVEAAAAEEVDVAVVGPERLAHVHAAAHVHDPVLGPARAEDGERGAVVRGDLDVDTGPARPECADELTDQTFALDPAHPRHHRQSRVEVEGDRTAGGFEDEPVYPHLCSVGSPMARLEARTALGVSGPEAGKLSRRFTPP